MIDPDPMTPEQSRNILNAFLEVRDKLTGLANRQAELDGELDTIRYLLWAVIGGLIANLVIQFIWIAIKLWIDRKQDMRFRAMVDIAEGHGAQTDLSKRQMGRRATEITDASAKAVRMATAAVRRADDVGREAKAATDKVDEAKRVMESEVHEINQKVDGLRETVMQLVKHLCPDLKMEDKP